MSSSVGLDAVAPLNGRGVAAADFDNDGRIEILIANMHEPPTLLRNFARPAGGAVLVEARLKNGRAAIEWGVYGMPETFVVNGRGEIVFKHVGAVTQESLQTRLMPAIAQAQSAANRN